MKKDKIEDWKKEEKTKQQQQQQQKKWMGRLNYWAGSWQTKCTYMFWVELTSTVVIQSGVKKNNYPFWCRKGKLSIVGDHCLNQVGTSTLLKPFCACTLSHQSSLSAWRNYGSLATQAHWLRSQVWVHWANKDTLSHVAMVHILFSCCINSEIR